LLPLLLMQWLLLQLQLRVCLPLHLWLLLLLLLCCALLPKVWGASRSKVRIRRTESCNARIWQPSGIWPWRNGWGSWIAGIWTGSS